MALDLKKFAVRSLSAIVFAVLLIGSIVYSYYTFAVFFFIVSMIGLYEFYKIAGKLGAKPFVVPGIIFGSLLYLSFVHFNYNTSDVLEGGTFSLHVEEKVMGPIIPSELVLVIFPFCIFPFLVFSKRENVLKCSFFTIIGVLYTVLPFALLHNVVTSQKLITESTGVLGESLPSVRPTYIPFLLLGIIFLIWSNDTFAYIGGSLFGKNKMIERVSPGKTWEGTAIGVLLTFGLSFLFQEYVYTLPVNIWPLLGFLVPILATIGDLIESKLKREAGVKDSGHIMPGHGGALDRFDSLIFVAPFVYLILFLFRS